MPEQVGHDGGSSGHDDGLFAEHDVQDHVVCGFHAGGADGANVLDGFFYVIVYDAVGGGDAGAFEGKDCRLNCA